MTIGTLYNPSESVWIITPSGITAATIKDINIKAYVEDSVCRPVILKEYTFFHEYDSRTEDKIFKTRNDALEYIMKH